MAEQKAYLVFLVSSLGAEVISIWLNEEEYKTVNRLAQLTYGRPQWVTVVEHGDVYRRE